MYLLPLWLGGTGGRVQALRVGLGAPSRLARVAGDSRILLVAVKYDSLYSVAIRIGFADFLLDGRKRGSITFFDFVTWNEELVFDQIRYKLTIVEAFIGTSFFQRGNRDVNIVGVELAENHLHFVYGNITADKAILVLSDKE